MAKRLRTNKFDPSSIVGNVTFCGAVIEGSIADNVRVSAASSPVPDQRRGRTMDRDGCHSREHAPSRNSSQQRDSSRRRGDRGL